MAGMRVHEVAKKLGLSSRETIEKLAALGVPVASHASSVSESDVARLTKSLDGIKPAPTGNGGKTARQQSGGKPALAQADGGRRPSPPDGPPAARPLEAPEARVASHQTVARGASSAEVIKLPEGKVPQDRGVEVSAPAAAVAPSTGVVHVPHGVTVEELADKLDRSPGDIIKLLLTLGEMKTITQSLSDELVDIVAQEMGVPVEIVSVEEEAAEEEAVVADEDDPAKLKPRGPIVTVMGHVDHGKSSILQQFRKKEMLSLEAGGITQAIGAYQVHSPDGRVVTFLDTPGHEAFTQMRARGAQVTDVAILVVAADDGVQPQTVEAMDHANAAGVPIVVAVNKIDKPEADPIRVRQQLSELGLRPEEWGGETVFVDVSAKKGTNLDDLLEMIHLVTDMQELKANPDAKARGVSIEAHLDKGRGPVATLIVQKGTLKVGDPVVCGSAWCRVRAMTDETGHHITSAGPSQPVLVTGWSKVPQAGDEFKVVGDEREAKRIAQEREAKLRQAEFAAGGRAMSLEDLLSRARTGELPELKIIAKANSQGAIEALVDSIEKMDQSLVRTNVLRRAVGAINENDVNMARASGAIIVGFGVRPDAGARQLAEREGVDIRLYEVIYQLLEDIERATKGLLAPIQEEVVTGAAEVREIFRTPRAVVAGCYVTEGRINRGARARLLREGKVIYTSEISSLRRFKDDVREVAAGYECGVVIQGYNDIKQGDVIEAFEIREVART